jgi:hypothetical protein
MVRKGFKGTPFDERTLRVFSAGDALEKWVVDLILPVAERRGAKILGIHVPVYNEAMGVSGKMDIFLLQDDGTPQVWEAKTLHSMAFQYGDLPYDAHRVQCVSYQEFYDLEVVLQATLREDKPYVPVTPLSEWPTEVSSGLVFYISKDDLRIENYEANKTSDRVDNLAETILTLNEWLPKDELPPVLPMIPEKRPDGSDFVYQVGPKKGETKMKFNSECARGNKSDIKCPFFFQCWPN